VDAGFGFHATACGVSQFLGPEGVHVKIYARVSAGCWGSDTCRICLFRGVPRQIPTTTRSCFLLFGGGQDSGRRAEEDAGVM